ncbi:hypothetical protein [Dongia sp. agr-C8]
MNDVENLRSVRHSLVIRRRDLASRGAMSPADGGRSATQIRNIQAEIDAIDDAIADEVATENAAVDRKALSAE